jgi:hypothetical protein
MGSKISTLVFQPPAVTYMHVKNRLIWLRTVRNTSIPAFYIDRKAKVTLLFSHGNAEDLGMIWEWFIEFSREVHVNILVRQTDRQTETVQPVSFMPPNPYPSPQTQHPHPPAP